MRVNKGFSLIETLVSLTIMAMITIGIMTAQGGHVRTADNSKKRTICTNLAEQAVERMFAMPYDNLLAMAGTTETEDYGSIANFPFFKRVSVVQQVNASSDLLSIQVEVYWKEAEAATIPSVLRVLRTKPPQKGV